MGLWHAGLFGTLGGLASTMWSLRATFSRFFHACVANTTASCMCYYNPSTVSIALSLAAL